MVMMMILRTMIIYSGRNKRWQREKNIGGGGGGKVQNVWRSSVETCILWSSMFLYDSVKDLTAFPCRYVLALGLRIAVFVLRPVFKVGLASTTWDCVCSFLLLVLVSSCEKKLNWVCICVYVWRDGGCLKMCEVWGCRNSFHRDVSHSWRWGKGCTVSMVVDVHGSLF